MKKSSAGSSTSRERAAERVRRLHQQIRTGQAALPERTRRIEAALKSLVRGRKAEESES